MFTFLQHVDPGDEDVPLPPPTKVCLMCQGQGVFYREAHDTWTAKWLEIPCLACKRTGRVKA